MRNTAKAARAAEAWPVNVGQVERLATTFGGGLLAALGLRRGGLAGAAIAALGTALTARGIAGHCPIYKSLGLSSAPDSRKVHIEHSMTIGVEPAILYDFWRDFENLPRFMPHLEDVRVLDDRRSHWVAKAPANATVSWDAEVVEAREPELIAWRAIPGEAQVWSAGEVQFRPAPGGRGTELHVRMEYAPPAGRLGQLVAKVAGEEPSNQVLDSLRRLKMIMEAGEVATSAMRPADDWEQGKQPWQRGAGDEGPAREREVGG